MTCTLWLRAGIFLVSVLVPLKTQFSGVFSREPEIGTPQKIPSLGNHFICMDEEEESYIQIYSCTANIVCVAFFVSWIGIYMNTFLYLPWKKLWQISFVRYFFTPLALVLLISHTDRYMEIINLFYPSLSLKILALLVLTSFFLSIWSRNVHRNRKEYSHSNILWILAFLGGTIIKIIMVP